MSPPSSTPARAAIVSSPTPMRAPAPARGLQRIPLYRSPRTTTPGHVAGRAGRAPASATIPAPARLASRHPAPGRRRTRRRPSGTGSRRGGGGISGGCGSGGGAAGGGGVRRASSACASSRVIPARSLSISALTDSSSTSASAARFDLVETAGQLDVAHQEAFGACREIQARVPRVGHVDPDAHRRIAGGGANGEHRRGIHALDAQPADTPAQRARHGQAADVLQIVGGAGDSHVDGVGGEQGRRFASGCTCARRRRERQRRDQRDAGAPNHGWRAANRRRACGA